MVGIRKIIKNFENYLKEQHQNSNGFKVGDVVSCQGQMGSVHFNGEIGIIIIINNREYCTVRFEKQFNPNFRRERDYYTYLLYFNLLKHADETEETEKIKKKIIDEENKERKERSERLKKNKEKERDKWWENTNNFF